MANDLKSMTVKQLEKLKNDIDTELAGRAKRKLEEARKAVEAAAKEHGFSLDEVLGKPKGKSRRARTATAKYRNPEDPSQTWAGRGRKPEWIKAAEAEGKSLKDFEV